MVIPNGLAKSKAQLLSDIKLRRILKNTIFVTYRKQKSYRLIFADTAGEFNFDVPFYESNPTSLVNSMLEDTYAFENEVYESNSEIPDILLEREKAIKTL